MFQALLAATLINCSYNLKEPINMSLNLTNRIITYTSRQAIHPVLIRISDITNLGSDTVVTGDLPSPWLGGSSYRIRLQPHSPFAAMTFVSPTGNSSIIHMVCH